jgi:tetratricopeptide (TPR) repeat protein
LLDRREVPQNVGAILYMGVRTFYDEELLNSCHPDLSRTYVRLTAPPATIVQYFGLDDEEFQLLRRIQPDDPASQLVETRKVERVHLLALLLLMRMAQFCEVFNHPQPRATSPRMPHARAQRDHSELARDDKSVARRAPGPPELPREDRSSARRAPTSPTRQTPLAQQQRQDKLFASTGDVAPEATPRQDRPLSRTGEVPPEPAPREDRSVARRAPTQPEPTRRDDRPFALSGEVPPEPTPREDRSFARKGPIQPESAPPHESPFARTGDVTPEPTPRHDRPFARTGEVPPEPAPRHDRPFARTGEVPPEPTPAQRPPPLTTRSAQAQAPFATHPATADSPNPAPPGRSARPKVDATQEALLEAAARTARMRRSLPARRNSKQADAMSPSAAEGGSVAARVQETSSAANSNAKATPAEARPEYAKAHLQELIARHKHTASAPESAAPSHQRDPARELREARNLLHTQHYARAEKVLAALVELEPANELYKTYHMWARWRAQPEAAEHGLKELQELAKKLVSDSEHGGFAAYVLGHVFLHNKRDDLAEKFFKRAHSADRGNKDAERHLMILERRKQTAAESGPSGNRKLFGIQLPNKPKS